MPVTNMIPPDNRDHADRQSHGQPAHVLMLEQSPGVVPKSLLGKGLTYLREQWPKLIRYVENGSWPISNNPCENAIRLFCVGRRGWLFSDTVDGANACANLYTLVETSKTNGIDLYRYLAWLFRRLPLAKTVDDYDALLPWRMPVDIHVDPFDKERSTIDHEQENHSVSSLSA
ncbi:transposase IS66 family protein [Burkholderia pseudomallei MSHR4378]|nr:transposase IS66 family protein [Burkholderia pseudomallei MSHR4378]